jgi:hypothetical protein
MESYSAAGGRSTGANPAAPSRAAAARPPGSIEMMLDEHWPRALPFRIS